MSLIAKILLETESVHLKPNEKDFFTWTSGKKSPLYCDNRQLISYPKARALITKMFCEQIKEHYPKTQLIAGTATAGIPWAAWIATELELPMIYIRSKPKEHGLKSALEGHVIKGQKTLIIEDLISTGKSSLSAYHFATQDELEVQAVFSIFNYDFKIASQSFQREQLAVHSLCGLDDLLTHAKSTGLITNEQSDIINKWRINF